MSRASERPGPEDSEAAQGREAESRPDRVAAGRICERCRQTTSERGRCPRCGHHELLDAAAPDTALWFEVKDAMRQSLGARIGALLKDDAMVLVGLVLFGPPVALVAVDPWHLVGTGYFDVCFLPSMFFASFVLVTLIASVARGRSAAEPAGAQTEPSEASVSSRDRVARAAGAARGGSKARARSAEGPE